MDIPNKASSKYLGFNREQWIIWEQPVVRSSSIKNRLGHPVNKKTNYGDCFDPKMFRDMHMEQKGPGSLKKISILSFSYPILRGSINTRSLMENPML